MSSRATLLALLVLAGACAAEQEPPPVFVVLTVWNRCSQSPDNPSFYEILELYAHPTQEYQSHPNLLATPLAVDARTTVNDFQSGSYITVVRRKNLGENIALTTSRGLDVADNCHVLQVFDDAFRLSDDPEACVFVDGGPDGGGADGGDPGGD